MIIGIDASRANLKYKTGTEWYSFYLIKYLAKLDQENKYILYLNTKPSADIQAIIEDNPNFSCRILYWPFYSFWTLGRLTWEMIWRRPDVLFIPAHALPLISPKHTINTIHDIAFTQEKGLYHSNKVKTSKPIFTKMIEYLTRILSWGKYQPNSLDYLHWSTDYALRKASHIITVSNFSKQEILRVFPRSRTEKITVIYNGYNNDLYKPITDLEKTKNILEKYGLEVPYFLYVGRLEKKKNTPLLIEAFSKLRDKYPEIKEKLVLVGNASCGYDEVKYLIEEYDLNKEVIMPGWIDEADMPYIFNLATTFVFPSRHEGFGIPILQAMACAVPVLASDIPVFHEIVGDNVLYFDHHDSNAMADALATIVNNPDLRQDLINKGLTLSQKFSWQKSAAETLALIKSLA